MIWDCVLNCREPIDLYELIRLRYENAATIITSNRDATELGQLFGDPLIASAAMDRLLHNAHIIELLGDSYRNPPADRRKKRTGKEKKAA